MALIQARECRLSSVFPPLSATGFLGFTIAA
jgi:hypothetical protein